MTTVVRGRIMMAMKRGERIPEGWALDRDGKPTTDPKEAIEHGSLFPIGGAKGAMLALMFELICASLTGAAIGPEADSFFSEEGNRPRIGQAFIAIDPAQLSGSEKFSERVESGRGHDARRSGSAPARRAPLRRGSLLEEGHRDPRRARLADREAMFDVVIEFPKMKVAVATRDERVVEIRYLPPSSSDVPPRNALAERAARQLERYRDDPDAKFDLPAGDRGLRRCSAPSGTRCARSRAARRAPTAKLRASLARIFPWTRAPIGQACGDNRLPIVIPCHRVVAADGIGGFGHATGGYLLEVKRWLLMHEAPAFELRP